MVEFVENYVQNAGLALGGLGSDILGGIRSGDFDPYLKRPYINKHGVRCVTVNSKYTGDFTVENGQRRSYLRQMPIHELWNRFGIMDPVFNAVSMRKEDWERVDTAVVRAARPRMTAWNDLASRSSLGGFDGMAKMTLEYEAMSDVGEAIVDFEGTTPGRNDSPLYKLRSLPLPITHSDFNYSKRRIQISENSNTPLDLASAEMSGRRIGESVEQTLVGTQTGPTYGTQSAGIIAHDGTSTVYGYTNYPYRITYTTLHTPDGTNPGVIMEDVLNLVDTLAQNFKYGPFMMYHSTGYSKWLNDDYFRAGSTSVVRSLRERIMAIDGIQGIKRLDFLTSGYQIILVQLDSETAQAVNGMELTTLQWPTQGGMKQNFKSLCIKVPLLKSQFNGVASILHATTS